MLSLFLCPHPTKATGPGETQTKTQPKNTASLETSYFIYTRAGDGRLFISLLLPPPHTLGWRKPTFIWQLPLPWDQTGESLCWSEQRRVVQTGMCVRKQQYLWFSPCFPFVLLHNTTINYTVLWSLISHGTCNAHQDRPSACGTGGGFLKFFYIMSVILSLVNVVVYSSKWSQVSKVHNWQAKKMATTLPGRNRLACGLQPLFEWD